MKEEIKDIENIEELEVEKKGEETSKKEKKNKDSKKSEKLELEIEKLKNDLLLSNEKVLRAQAEMMNFKRRKEEETSYMLKYASEDVIKSLLPVIDNFERGLATVPEDKQEDPFVSGMQMVYKQLMTELENAGVKAIECAGQEFNPDFHNAVMQVESEELESGIIAQELQKGYMYKDSVVRHSMVSVVQ